jgi:ATP-dependent DNA helicase RecG
MNPTELRTIIQNGETAGVEFKVATPRELEVAQRLCGLANSQGGGLLIIGVADESWQIIGVENPSKDIDDILKAARKCDPSLELPTPQVIELDDKKLVIVQIPPNSGKIYQVSGTYLLRRGTHTSAMTTSELTRFMYRQTALHWEVQPVLNSDLSALDMVKVRQYQENLVRMSRRSAANHTDLAELLVKIKCAVKVQDDPLKSARIYPTNAGLLLFGHTPDEFLTQAEVVLTYYQDSSGIRRYNDRRIVTGSLAEQIEKSWEILKLWTPISARIEGVHRIDEPALPLEALREAIVNALVHRDYSLEGTAVRVFYYPDRVEIYNPGLLVPGLTLDQLQRGEAPSNPRNPVITTVLRDLPGGFMERVGSGVRFMINQMRDMGLGDPQFKEQGEFIASFRRKPLNPSLYQRSQSEMPLTGTGGVNRLEDNKEKEEAVVVQMPNRLILPGETRASSTSAIPKLTTEEKMALNAQERQELALQYVREQGLISHKIYQELTGASESTATRDLKVLIANGALRQVGRGPGRKYVI